MTSWLRGALFFALIFVLSRPAGAAEGTAYRVPPAAVAAGLRRLIDRDRAAAPLNHFCVVGEKGDGYDWTYIFWQERHQLITWSPPYTIGTMDANSILDLTKDVVPTDADLGGSTYLVSRPWVDALRRYVPEP